MTTTTNLKPFHETIVEEIQKARLPDQFLSLTRLIMTTAVPKGHDEIIAAIDQSQFSTSDYWTKTIAQLKSTLLAQKEQAEKTGENLINTTFGKLKRGDEFLFDGLKLMVYEDQHGSFAANMSGDGKGQTFNISPWHKVQKIQKGLTEYVYSYGINPIDRRDSYGGGDGVITANSDEEAVRKIHERHGQPPVITIDWIYAVHHKVNFKDKR